MIRRKMNLKARASAELIVEITLESLGQKYFVLGIKWGQKKFNCKNIFGVIETLCVLQRDILLVSMDKHVN